MTLQRKPKPPKHLRIETRRWWLSVVEDYELEPHHVRLLTMAAEAWDRAVEAREAIAKSGAYMPNRFGEVRPHPALGVERDSRIAFARLVRELALDVNEPGDPRPPSIGR